MKDVHVDGPAVVDLNHLIDAQRVRRSAVVFLVIATLAMVADGFDISAMGFVAPELIKAWHIAPAALVPVLSAGVLGLMFGAPLIGYLGDRFGRKRAVIVALGVVGVFTLASAAARNLEQFVVLRFLTGLGLGGLIPNVIALAAELAPKRLRGVFIIIVNFGVPAGIALPGWIAALFVPTYGWSAILLVGGLLPLLAALSVFLFVQESIRYLLYRGGSEERVRRLVETLSLTRIDPRARIVGTVAAFDPPQARGSGLFSDGLAVLTPVMWLALAANQFANFFTVSWLPTLLQAAGESTAQAGISASMFSIGGLFGGLVLLFAIDRFGALPIVLLFLIGAPTVAAIGNAHVPPAMLGAIIAGAGFCVTGNNFGLNAVLGIIYPTSSRAKGTGWAQAFGRVGAFGAPYAGGALMARHVLTGGIFLAPACALTVGAMAAVALAMLCFRRFRSFELDEAVNVASNVSYKDPTPPEGFMRAVDASFESE